eukprot:9751593-Alexandrium_andersonii.AAC.1
MQPPCLWGRLAGAGNVGSSEARNFGSPLGISSVTPSGPPLRNLSEPPGTSSGLCRDLRSSALRRQIRD